MNPDTQGFRMPAEWEPHAGTWLAWPHNRETWPGQDMNQIEAVVLRMIRALHTSETVHVLVNNADQVEQLQSKLQREELHRAAIKIHIIPTDDAWIRDFGPNFLTRSTPQGNEVSANLWKFDSWGEKYEWQQDAQAGRAITDYLNCPSFDPGIVLEGGAIEVNGQGTCITTEQCLLNPNRNGGLSRLEMEGYLKNFIGAQHILWCQGELEGDDTDGHIDNLVRFVNPNTVLCSWQEDVSDPNHACLKANVEFLKNSTDQAGHALQVELLPMPDPVMMDGTRLPASYANFYIANKTILLPNYNQPNDAVAQSILQTYFPDREVVGIPCHIFIMGLGGIHCVTQQQPK